MTTLRDLDLKLFYNPADDPLRNFYIPVLSAAVKYDRSAGFFSSTALAVAAEGIAHLIQNGGKMRLLVGAQLDEADVEAIRNGHDLQKRVEQRMLERFPDPQDALLKQRLEALAWMVSQGTLEIKVVLAKDDAGLPIPYQPGGDYFHAKGGVFTDAEGNQIGFTGSINETEMGWLKNYETFLVLNSWDNPLHIKQLTHNFNALWNEKEKDWIALKIPTAVAQRLLQYRPSHPPVRDALEVYPQPPQVTDNDNILFQYIIDAPHLINAKGLGAATAAISPWPHQTSVAESVLRRFPERAMLCDEVGLGKTIEAGLILRQLLLSGKVKRCLILTPKSVLKQWQEELYEKFALRIPLYDGSRYWDVYEKPLAAPPGNPWEAYPVMLAGSQLAKRTERHTQILASQGWDLLLVDEAHHARRKDFKEHIYRPNRLLSLLNDLNQYGKIGSLLMMTATPMQVHPVEVWDLLTQLGLGARWGSDEQNFLHYFSELQKTFETTDWDFIFDMLSDTLRIGGEIDPAFAQQAVAEVGPVQWESIQALIHQPGSRQATVKRLPRKAHALVRELARTHTPLKRLVYRNTRTLLREYQRQGILRANVPTRRPQLVRVPMREEEYALYERIDEYISHFYQKYESERRGMGFIMTVYRRRLTSSFYAVRCSLERRLKYLTGGVEEFLTDDDREQEDLSFDLDEELPSQDQIERFKLEIEYLQDFLSELRHLSVNDSKMEYLKDELGRIFRSRPTVLIFTQYTDTLDYLRDQLCEVYGSKVACYSGRGGEVWNGLAWVTTKKDNVKSDFKDGKIRILLCTESASEGLNLQTCGVLINYDMPWNPMRVEQRIGRIDRIGQDYPEVWISNYFYQDTIEDVIYQRLADRINWFEVVVGDLQPILAEVGEVTRRLAMLPANDRPAQLEQEIAALKLRIQNREVEALNLDAYAETGKGTASSSSPVTLSELEKIFTQSKHTAARFSPHPEIPRAYLFQSDDGSIPATFDPACYDEHATTVQYLTFGSSTFDVFLQGLSSTEPPAGSGIFRISDPGDPAWCAWYIYNGHKFDRVENIQQIQQHLQNPPKELPTEEALIAIREAFAREVAEQRQSQAEVVHQRKMGVYLAEKARAQTILLKAATIEIALGQQPEILDPGKYPAAFSEQAVLGLSRHKYPWAPLLALAYDSHLQPRESDEFYQQIKNNSRDSLRGRFNQLVDEAKKQVRILKNAKDQVDEKQHD